MCERAVGVWWQVNNIDEECDDGNKQDHDGCSHLCRAEFCGDGTKQVSAFVSFVLERTAPLAVVMTFRVTQG